jgi:ABC-type glycerol-3-phosphate transport system permease component
LPWRWLNVQGPFSTGTVWSWRLKRQVAEVLSARAGATAALALIPALLFLLMGQRYIVKGLTTGALK